MQRRVVRRRVGRRDRAVVAEVLTARAIFGELGKVVAQWDGLEVRRVEIGRVVLAATAWAAGAAEVVAAASLCDWGRVRVG